MAAALLDLPWTQLHLCQGNRPIEDYVEEFCGLCYQVGINDVALKGIFRNGLNDLLNYLMPGSDNSGTLAKYMDYTLLNFGIGLSCS